MKRILLLFMLVFSMGVSFTSCNQSSMDVYDHVVEQKSKTLNAILKKTSYEKRFTIKSSAGTIWAGNAKQVSIHGEWLHYNSGKLSLVNMLTVKENSDGIEVFFR